MPKYGKIAITDANLEIDKEKTINTLVHLRFFPFSVVHLYGARMFEMIGESYLFEEIEVGTKIPFYQVEITDLENGEQEIKVVRT